MPLSTFSEEDFEEELPEPPAGSGFEREIGTSLERYPNRRQLWVHPGRRRIYRRLSSTNSGPFVSDGSLFWLLLE